jgi:tight adherence protein C
MQYLTVIDLSSNAQLLLAAAIFACVMMSILLVTAPASPTPAGRLARYAALGRQTAPVSRLDVLSAPERLGGPIVGSLVSLAAELSPPIARQKTAARLAMAGMGTRSDLFIATRLVFFLAVPALVAFVILRSGPPTPTTWGTLVLSVLLGRRLPEMWLKRRIRARQRAIDRSLPYALDLMVACLEGGLSLEGSLAKIAQESTGPLAAEIGATLQEITLGRPAGEAMRALGERTGAPDLKRFTTTIVQAERMGIAIAEAMRTLSRESRSTRRQRAEEMARKAPIKMVPVLIFCVLPALMVVVMTPAVLTVTKMFADQAR